MASDVSLDRDGSANHARAGRARLDARVVPLATVSRGTSADMFGLYARHYADTSERVFMEDLRGKTHVLLLEGEGGELCGFSTIECYARSVDGRAVRVIFSGDTIIDPTCWGSSTFAIEWLRFAGRVHREEPDTPLFWLLIVKGHRTYRFLPTFAHAYVPHPHAPADPGMSSMRDALAAEKFASAYDPSTGVVRFAQPRGRLVDALAEVPARHQRIPSVAFFLRRNPGYRRGDELVCLCELSASNMKPLASRAFGSGPGAPGG